MRIIKEFREFTSRGNVVDLAVGIIIGAAFGKIVSSLVADVIMPPIGLLVGGINFTDIKFILKNAVDAKPAVTLNIGSFIQVVFDFMIVAMAVFIIIKANNRMKRKELPTEITPANSVEVPQTKEELLLSEIRDILSEKK